jgi:DnaJ-class molecular chaperone
MDNLYTILGVAESASESEIKKAYRTLAKEHHPDKNHGNKEAEEKFKSINEAYATLSDATKRAEYDNIRKYGSAQHNPFRQGGFNANGFDNIDDIIKNFFNQNGFGGRPFTQQRRNSDLELSLEISMEEAFTGKDVPINFTVNNVARNLTVKIPPGVANGARMRFNGQGDHTNNTLPPGDLYIQVHISDSTVYSRRGNNLYKTIVVDAIDAIVGSTYELSCIDKSTINLSIPAGVQHGNILKVAGKGMPTTPDAKHFGDMLVIIEISIPKTLTTAHAAAIKSIQAERQWSKT